VRRNKNRLRKNQQRQKILSDLLLFAEQILKKQRVF